MLDIESRIARVADGISELPEGGDYAKELYAILATIRDDLIGARSQAYQKYQNALVKWLEFHNEVVTSERGGQETAAAQERARILRLLIASNYWVGGYQKLLDLIDK